MGRKSNLKKKKRNKHNNNPDPIQEAINDFKKYNQKYNIPPSIITENDKQRLLDGYKRTKQQLKDKITNLIEIFQSFDPFRLLSFFSNYIFLIDPHKDQIENHYEAHTEYVLSLITALENPNIANIPDDEDILHKARGLVIEVLKDTFYLFLVEGVKYLPDYEKSLIRYQNILRHLFLRGDSFPQHHIELLQEQFASQSDFFQEHFGLPVIEIIEIFSNIVQEVEKNFRKQQTLYKNLQEAHKFFYEFIAQKEKEGISDYALIEQEYLNTPEYKLTQKMGEESDIKIGDCFFIINPSLSIPQIVLERLSLNFGDNKTFIDNPYFSGFPLGDSLIYKKPLIKYKEQYYCFAPHVLLRHGAEILENWIKGINQKYYNDKYQKKKGVFLEEKAISYFKAIFPTAQIYHDLEYFTQPDKKGQGQLDGLILYDNSIIVIEAKANAFRLPARRGSIDKTKSDTGSIIQNAYKQAIRAKRYIIENDNPIFYTSDRKTITIVHKQKYDNIYLVNVTLENLGHLTAHIDTLKYFNYLDDDNEQIWSVFINDLRVISEIIDTPSEFLLYLQRRLKINEHPEISAIDELDLFGYFLQTGLYFDDVEFIGGMNFTIGPSFTNKIEEYYYAPILYGKSVEKPKFVISDELRSLVKKLETTQKDGRSKITTAILDLDGTINEELMGYLRGMLDSALKSPSMSNFVFPFPEANWGLMAVVNYPSDLKALEEHCLKNSYLHKVTNWFLLLLDVKENTDYDIDFKVFEQQWKFDPEMEKEVEELRIERVVKYIAEHGKIGRNDPCPCFSGKKYKKCCQHKVESLGN